MYQIPITIINNRKDTLSPLVLCIWFAQLKTFTNSDVAEILKYIFL